MRRHFWLAAGTAGLGLLLWRQRQRLFRPPPPQLKAAPDRPRIVILGAGFAGLTVARHLAHRLQGQADILIIDRHNYHLFTPMLYQVAAWGLVPYNIAFPVRNFARPNGIEFRRAIVTSIDLDGRCVRLGADEVGYDYLVVALGTVPNFFDIKGAQEYTLPLNWLEEGIAIRHHLIDRLEEAALALDPDVRQVLLTFVIVGGGPTGVETAAALVDLLHRVLPIDYPRLDPEEARVILIEMESRLLPTLNEEMGRLTQAQLEAAGIEVWLESKVTAVAEGELETGDGRSILAQTIIWASGVRAPDVVAEMDASQGPGGSVSVDQYLRLQGHPNVFAIGDNASFKDPETGDPVPLLAQAAIQEGEVAAANLIRTMEGRELQPFRYRSLGNVITLGRLSGVAEVGDRVVGGFLAWLVWRLIHLAKLTTFRNQVATILDWSVGYLYTLNTTRFNLEPSPPAIEQIPEVEELKPV